GLAHALLGQREDQVALGGIFLGSVPAGEKTVVGVEGGVEQILPVELLEDDRVEQIGRGLRVAGMGRAKLLETGDSVGIIKIVEILVGSAHLRVVVHRVGMHVC